MSSHIKLSFRRMGAEIDITQPESRRTPIFAIDVRETKEGERFELTGRQINKEDIKILDIEEKNKHLLLMWYERETGTKHKYLCGHDERHWFVAAIPENKGAVKNVPEAMEALKPDGVKDREQKVGLKGDAKRSRWNPAWKRQGEWFFVPVWNTFSIKKAPILKNEPIQRGRAKPHMCEFMVRDGGERVQVCNEYPNGITLKAYEKLIKKEPSKARLRWRVMTRDAKVFVKGRVSHPDHATINLGHEWHEVLMNRENEAPSMKHMRFLD